MAARCFDMSFELMDTSIGVFDFIINEDGDAVKE